VKRALLLLMIAASPVLASSAAAKPGKSSSRASAYTYKLMDGTVVPMSQSQRAISAGLCRQLTPVELYRLESPVVVTVACDLGDKISQGTGVIVNENTIITNWHVVRGTTFFTMEGRPLPGYTARNIVAWDYNGTKYENGRLENFSMSVDVACITFDTMHSTRWAAFVTDSNWEMPGEAVYTIGAPEGMDQTFTNGIFSGWLANGATFRFTAPTGHGGSGGPVFNAYGQVIGIVRGGFGEGGGLNFAISTNAILEALHLNNGDHPNGFVTGVTNGVELRSKEEIAKDDPAALTDAKVGDFIPDTKQPIQPLWPNPKSSVPTANNP
jgi:S1-C subfamily serine protease